MWRTNQTRNKFIRSVKTNLLLLTYKNIFFCSASSESDSVQLLHDELQIQLPKKQSPRPSYPPTDEDIATYRDNNHRVILNIGGSKFEVELFSFPNSDFFEGLELINGMFIKVMWRTFEPRILSRLGKLYRAKTHQKIMELVDMYNLGRPSIIK